METQDLAAEYESPDEQESPDKSSTHENDRTPAERHAFVFGHNLKPATDRDFRPLPFQVAFLIDVYAENVGTVGQIVHMPTIRKMTRDMRNGGQDLSPANEALMFSIYYAAVISMEDNDVSFLLTVSTVLPLTTPRF
jgi:hypothetical protein